MRLLWIAAAIAAVQTNGAAAEDVSQFDLVCNVASKMQLGDATPKEIRYRIDLEGKRWCWAKCERPQAVAEVTPDRLALRLEPLDRAGDEAKLFISRQSGELFETTKFGGRVVTFNTGTCTPASFSGLPPPKF